MDRPDWDKLKDLVEENGCGAVTFYRIDPTSDDDSPDLDTQYDVEAVSFDEDTQEVRVIIA
jgi:hypothetical protein